jgi:hypothetical protein
MRVPLRLPGRTGPCSRSAWFNVVIVMKTFEKYLVSTSYTLRKRHHQGADQIPCSPVWLAELAIRRIAWCCVQRLAERLE